MYSESKKFYPVFLVGHSRSGSTLLASILSEHSQILALPETHFFPKTYAANFVGRVVSRITSKRLIDRLYENNRIRDAKLTKEELEQFLRGKEVHTYCQLYRVFLEACLSKSYKTRIFEKTPRHIEYVEYILKCFPSAKVICIVRDGRDAVNSLVAVPWTHCNKERHAAYWAWCVREASRLEGQFAGSFLIVRYEDLLVEPEATLKTICTFIGEEFEHDMLIKSRSDVVVPEWEKEWKTKSKSKLDVSFAYKWKKNINKDELSYIQYFMKNELDFMGYELIDKKVKIPIHKRVIWGRAFFGLLFKMMWLYRTHLFPRKRDFRQRSLDMKNGG